MSARPPFRRPWDRFLRPAALCGLILFLVAACSGDASSPPGGRASDRSVAAPVREPWFGGPGYYARFPSARGWTDPAFFPIGVWFMRANQQSEIDLYTSLGANVDFAVEDNASLPLLGRSGVWGVPHKTSGVAAESVGYTLTDEPDMAYRAGHDPWSGVDGWNTCVPVQDKGGKCGYTYLDAVSKRFPSGDGRLRYLNLGKGVFPGWMSDDQFAAFVNTYSDAVSDDIFWYTDPGICSDAQGPTLIRGSGPVSKYTGLRDLTAAECRRAANYGAVVERMRAMDAKDGRLQPVYAFVETGAPFTDGARITGPQIEGAVMSSLIHGAAGIIYFKHNFGGTCVTNDVFVDCRDAPKDSVRRIDDRIRSLAPVLNEPTLDFPLGPGVDGALKKHGQDYYVLAMAADGEPGRRSFRLPPVPAGARVEVLFEDRTLPVIDQSFADDFAEEYSYHVYRVRASGS